MTAVVKEQKQIWASSGERNDLVGTYQWIKSKWERMPMIQPAPWTPTPNPSIAKSLVRPVGFRARQTTKRTRSPNPPPAAQRGRPPAQPPAAPVQAPAPIQPPIVIHAASQQTAPGGDDTTTQMGVPPPPLDEDTAAPPAHRRLHQISPDVSRRNTPQVSRQNSVGSDFSHESTTTYDREEDARYMEPVVPIPPPEEPIRHFAEIVSHSSQPPPRHYVIEPIYDVPQPQPQKQQFAPRPGDQPFPHLPTPLFPVEEERPLPPRAPTPIYDNIENQPPTSQITQPPITISSEAPSYPPLAQPIVPPITLTVNLHNDHQTETLENKSDDEQENLGSRERAPNLSHSQPPPPRNLPPLRGFQAFNENSQQDLLNAIRAGTTLKKAPPPNSHKKTGGIIKPTASDATDNVIDSVLRRMTTLRQDLGSDDELQELANEDPLTEDELWRDAEEWNEE